MDPELLIPNPRNPNQHSDKQINLLAKIIKAQGWRAPITISKRSGFVVRGHGRLAAALSLGLIEVPVDIQEYESDAAEYADLIADNRLAELSNIDNSLLVELLKETDDYASFTGFNDKEIDKLVSEAECLADNGKEDNFDAAAAAESIKEPITQEGDMWLLGSHRLYCGDSTEKESAEILMENEKADMVFTDPPYNVNYEGKTKEKLTIKNDHMHPTMKPVALCARGILNSSRKGEIVFEPFAGSGSTLIACEQTGRRCRAIELDPVYCDVIIKRYINWVGRSSDVYLIRNSEKLAYSSL